MNETRNTESQISKRGLDSEMEKKMRVKHNEGYDRGITITHNGGKIVLDNVDEIIKLLEKIEVSCWGSSSYTD